VQGVWHGSCQKVPPVSLVTRQLGASSLDATLQSTLVVGDKVAGSERVLTQPALAFISRLHNEFEARRRELLQLREVRQREIRAGRFPVTLSETANIRHSEWQVARAPGDLDDRRVEITGPVDRKMVVNALNSGAKVFMADFEDSLSPT
jgi:malate synthase